MALAALVVLRVLGAERGTVLVLLVGALPLTLLPAYGVLAVAVAHSRRALGAGAAALVVAHLLVVAPALGADEMPEGSLSAPRLRVVTANLYVLNDDPAATGRALRELRPDVLVVPELSADGLAGLRGSGLLDELPHRVARLGTREETIGLLSRLPLQDTVVRLIGGRELPRASVVVDGVEIRLLAAHPLPPLPVVRGLWRAALEDLAREAAEVGLPLVVAGDLNGDRDHAAFRELLAVGLRDAHDSVGRGLARTWPSSFPVLHLDHVLVREALPV